MFKRRKKGFTLIEMMAVIAIIAVLVSIVVPTVGGHLNKANAATNAANMRAVKGQVSTMLLQGQITYKTSDTDNRIIAMVDDMIADAKAAEIDWLVIILEAGKGILSDLSDGGEYLDTLNNTYYAADGKVDIDGTILTAPGAKNVKLSKAGKTTFNLRKDTQMTITVTKNDIIVTYGGLTIDTMAVIAENGDTTEIDWEKTEHKYTDSNGDRHCDFCGKEEKFALTEEGMEQAKDQFENALGGSHRCVDSNSDCICDDANCKLKIPCVDSNKDCKCDVCKTLNKHTFKAQSGCGADKTKCTCGHKKDSECHP